MKRFIFILIMMLASVVNADWLGTFNIDEYVPIHITTSQFSTGALLTTANAQYRIYEETNGTFSTTEVVGPTSLTMDFDGQTGLHVGSVQLSAANTFEVGKSYVIFVEATVDSVVAGTSHGFRIRAAPLAIASGVNMTSISGDSTAADNLESTYDGTGYNDDVAPAQQQQLDNIANTGAAINVVANTAVITEGEQTLTFTATQSLNGVYHEIEDDAINTGQIDLYYEFDIGATGVPVSATFHGRLYDPPATGDVITIYANTWGSGFTQVGTLNGINNDTPAGDVTETVTLFTNHVGLGDDAGRVQLRFFDNGNVSNNTILKLDLVYCSYSVVVSPVGYANGQIWVDTVNGVAGTAEGINGVADNPVGSWADALTLSGTTGLTSFRIHNGSSITLSGTVDNFVLQGEEWVLDLNGQSCSDSAFIGAHVSGVCTGGEVIFRDCDLSSGGTLTVAGLEAHNCALRGAIVLTAVNTYYLDQCYSGVAGTGTPSIDFGSGVANQSVNFRHYSGGIEIKNIGTLGTDNMSLEGWGQLILNNNADGGTIAIRGDFTITDNAAGGYSGTLSDDARFTSSELVDDTWDEPRSGHTVDGTFGGDALDSDIWTDARAGFLDELSSGNTLYDNIVAIKALWDSLTITGGYLEVDIKAVDGTAVKSTNGNVHALPGNI